MGTVALREQGDECGARDCSSISVWGLPRDCGEGCWEDEMQRLPIASGSCELERCYSHWDLFSMESISSYLKIHLSQPQKQIHQQQTASGTKMPHIPSYTCHISQNPASCPISIVQFSIQTTPLCPALSRLAHRTHFLTAKAFNCVCVSLSCLKIYLHSFILL